MAMVQRHDAVVMFGMAIVAIMMGLEGMHATMYTVGGLAGWSPGTDLKAWASEYTFYVGDALYFPYSYGESSVLLVTETAYSDCASDSPVASDGGAGDMTITLTYAQTYYFISGYADQCSQGLHVAINVLDAPATNVNNNNPNNNNPNNNNGPNNNNNNGPNNNNNNNGPNNNNNNNNNGPNNNNNNVNNIPNSPVIFLPPPHTTAYLPNFAHSSCIASLFAPLVALGVILVFTFVV